MDEFPQDLTLSGVSAKYQGKEWQVGFSKQFIVLVGPDTGFDPTTGEEMRDVVFFFLEDLEFINQQETFPPPGVRAVKDHTLFNSPGIIVRRQDPVDKPDPETLK